MSQYINEDWFTEIGIPTLDGDGELPLNTWIEQTGDLGAVDLEIYGLAMTSNADVFVWADASQSKGSDFTPWIEGQTIRFGDVTSATNPVVWLRAWAYEASTGSEYAFIGLGASDAQVQSISSMENFLDDVIAINNFTGRSCVRILEWGNRADSFSWRRVITNKSLSGTAIIPTGNITWGREPSFTGPVSRLILAPRIVQIADLEVTVTGSTSLTGRIWWHDPGDPATWQVSAAYGFVPNPAKSYVSATTQLYESDRSWALTNADLLDSEGYGTNSYFQAIPAVSDPVGGIEVRRPFAFEIVDNSVGPVQKSYWEFGDPYQPWPLAAADTPLIAQGKPTSSVRLGLSTVLDGGAP